MPKKSTSHKTLSKILLAPQKASCKKAWWTILNSWDVRLSGILRSNCQTKKTNIPDGQEMKSNAPLFTVPKPGQPGQWRCIADMKSGGQNYHIGKDPVHLPEATRILEQLYMGGWSAVVDASKFFHNFPTHPKDHPHLGCIHPRTGQRLWYLGLPMGSSNSPALACRYGLGML